MAGAPEWPGWRAAVSLLALGALGTGVAYILNFRVIREAGPTIASTVTYVVPVWSTLFGTLLLSELLNWNTVAGAVLVVAGVLLTRGRAAAARRGGRGTCRCRRGARAETQPVTGTPRWPSASAAATSGARASASRRTASSASRAAPSESTDSSNAACGEWL
ncbi:DMT family transporter [Streptomyces nogalater]